MKKATAAKSQVQKQKKRESRQAQAAPARQSRPELWMFALGALVALGVTFQVYAPAMHGPFLFDDSYLPMNAPGLADRPLSNWIIGVRPLLMASYWINHHFSAGDTTAYHETGVCFHFLNAILIYL